MIKPNQKRLIDFKRGMPLSLFKESLTNTHKYIISKFYSKIIPILHFLGFDSFFVVFSWELQIFQELGVNTLHWWISVRLGSVDTIAMVLPVLVMVCMVLWLGHSEYLQVLLGGKFRKVSKFTSHKHFNVFRGLILFFPALA